MTLLGRLQQHALSVQDDHEVLAQIGPRADAGLLKAADREGERLPSIRDVIG